MLGCVVGWDVAIYEGQLAVYDLLLSMVDAGQVFDSGEANRQAPTQQIVRTIAIMCVVTDTETAARKR